jgi:prevent-host-death family protein
MNSITAAELKRRGMAAVEEALKRGPIHLMKRNKPAAVVLSEADYEALTAQRQGKAVGMSAMQWLLGSPPRGRKNKSELDAILRAERALW